MSDLIKKDESDAIQKKNKEPLKGVIILEYQLLEIILKYFFIT